MGTFSSFLTCKPFITFYSLIAVATMSSVILNRFLSVSAGGNLASLPGRSILDGPRGLMPLPSQLRNISVEKLRGEMEVG